MVEVEVLDDIIRSLGTGKWNLLTFFVIAYWFNVIVYHALGGAFLAPAVGHTCRIPPGGQPVIFQLSHDENNTSIDQCHYIPEGATDYKEPCLEWDFDNSTFGHTITSEFGLVCEKTYLRSIYQSMYMFGSFIAAPVGGILADKYGRKLIFTVGSVWYFVVSIMSCWLPNMSSILASRFLLGLMHTPTMNAGYILAMEVCKPSLRSMVGVFVVIPWATGTILWGVFAYFIRQWRWLQLIISIPTIIIFPAVWYMDESPRLLAVQGKHEQALKVFRKAARWNGVSLPQESVVMRLMKAAESQSSSASHERRDIEGSNIRIVLIKLKNFALELFVLFRTPRLRLITVVVWIVFLLSTTVFYGLLLNAVNFSADPYIYMIISGAMEIPAYAFTPFIAARVGRKIPTIAGCFCSALCLLGLPFINKELSWLIMLLVMMGKLTITASYQLLYLYSAELFPTEVRLQGFGSGIFLSRAGGMLAPFITDLLGSVYPWSPSVVFGVFSVVCGGAIFLLPETLKRPLPDTIADLENSSFRKRNRSSEDGDGCEMEAITQGD